MAGPRISECIGDVGNRFGLALKDVDHSCGVWRVWDIHGNQYAIKKFRRGISALVLGCHAHIKAGEIAPGLLPTLLQTSGKFPFIYYNGAHFIGMNWVAGRPLDYLRMSDRLRAFHTLIRWQTVVQGIEVPLPLRVWSKRRTILEERIQEMKECRKMARRLDDDFSRVYLKDWEFYYREASLARSLLDTDEYRLVEELSEVRGEICHHDWAHHNLILDPSGQVTVLDLEYVQGDLRMTDFIDLLNRFLQLDRGSPSAITRFFHWLKRVQPLSMEENRCFQIMFKWPEAYWISGRQYFIEEIYRAKNVAVERYRRKVPSPHDWRNWQQVLAESSGLAQFE